MKNLVKSKLSARTLKSVRLGMAILEDRTVLSPANLSSLASYISTAQTTAPVDPTDVATTSATLSAYESAHGQGITLVGSELYILGDGHDYVGVSGAGASPNGSTGVTVNSNLGSQTFNTPITKIHVYLTSGSNSVQISESLKTGVALFIGGGNDYVYLGGGDAEAWIGGSCNTIQGCNGNDNIAISGDENSVGLMNGNSRIWIGGSRNSVILGTGNHDITIAGQNSYIQFGDGALNTIHADGYTTVHGGNGKIDATFLHGHDGVTGGNGEHRVTVYCPCGNNLVNFGDGPSWINLNGGCNNVVEGRGDAIVHLGGGNNYVNLGDGHDDVTIDGNCNTVILGNGDHTVVVGTNTYLQAGNGNNDIVIGGSSSVILGNGTENVKFRNKTGSINNGGGYAVFTTDGGAWIQHGTGALNLI